MIGLWAAVGIAAQVAAGHAHLVVVTGIGGDAAHQRLFHDWAVILLDAAEHRIGMPSDAITYLADQPDRDPRSTVRSSKQNVLQTLDGLAERVQPDDLVVIVLIGHGSARGEEARFNVTGPDLTPADLVEALQRFPTQPVAVVNVAQASGGFLGPLSGPNRTVITATKSVMERNETRFGGFFVEAFRQDGADTDKDGRVSMLEAFTYARREVVRLYETDRQLLTEHAQLDDNGDGVGSEEPGPTGTDGAVAQTLFLAPGSPAVLADAEGDSVLTRLLAEKAALERDIATLRSRRGSMAADAYDAALEDLLVDLALTEREIRRRREGTE